MVVPDVNDADFGYFGPVDLSIGVPWNWFVVRNEGDALSTGQIKSELPITISVQRVRIAGYKVGDDLSRLKVSVPASKLPGTVGSVLTLGFGLFQAELP
jgi:hypothetical protein